MPLLSTFVLLQSLSATLISLGVLLTTSPKTVLNSSTLAILGSSMHIRQALFIPEPPLPSRTPDLSVNPLASLTHSTKIILTESEKELLALLGVVVFMAGVSLAILAAPLRFSKRELTSRTTDDGKTIRKASAEVGESIAKLNLSQTTWQFFSGGHVVMSSIFVAWIYLFRSERRARPSTSGRIEGLDLLANNVTFTLGMVDMLFWGYLYTNIREERRQVMEIRERRHLEDEEDEVNNRTT